MDSTPRDRAWLVSATRELATTDRGNTPPDKIPRSQRRVPHRLARCLASPLARRHLLPLALYLGLTVVMTFPLALHFGTALPGDGRDGWQNYWNFWWTRQALLHDTSPFWTPLLYAPQGAPLYLHTLNLFNGVLTLPLQLAFGVTAAYNTAVFLSFTLAAYFSFLLVSYVTGSRLAGFAGGVSYAFGTYHLMHLLGHTNLLASEWLPAYLLCLVTATDACGHRRLVLAVAAVVALLLLMFCDWQYVLFAALFTPLYALYTAVTRRSCWPLLVAGAIGALWLVAAAPLLAPTIAEIRATAPSRPAVFGPERFPADLLSFVVPGPLQSWWGRQAERLGGLAVAPAVERAVFLGYLPLLLSAIGVWHARRRALVWLGIALTFALLALGPTLTIAGQSRFGPTGWSLPLPYRLLERVPGLNLARVPARFALLVTLCLAVLSGFGIRFLATRFATRWPRPALSLAYGVLILALLSEHLAIPYPLTPVTAPPAFQWLAAQPEPGTVLEFPVVLERSRSLFYQTIHGRPIVGGYLSRPLAYPYLTLPLFQEAAGQRMPPDIAPPPDPGLGAWTLAIANVGWIAVFRDDPRLNQAVLAPVLRAYAAPTPRYDDGRVALYQPRPPGPPLLYVQPGQGWYRPESLAGSATRMRWFGSSATLDAWNFSHDARDATLCLTAWSYAQPRRLALYVDGRNAAEWRVGATARYTLSLALTPGYHALELRALDPPARPSDAGASSDTRLLSIGVARVELSPTCH